MRQAIRLGHAAAAWLFVAAILGQVFLAGLAIVQLGGGGDFSLHREFGYTALGLLALAVLLTAVLAGAGRRRIWLSFGLLLLYVVQVSLPEYRSSMPVVAALHPLNAMLLFGLATWYARLAWRSRSTGAVAQREGR